MARRFILVLAAGAGVASFVSACVGDEVSPAPGTDAGAGVDSAGSGDGAQPGPPDASSDGSPDADAEIDAGPRCDPNKPFPAPTEVTELNIGGATYARLSPDMKTVIFGANPDATFARLYQATRASADVPFGTPVPVPGIDTLDGGTALQANTPTMSPDGLVLYFQSVRSGTVKIYVSTRATASAPFGPPAILEDLDDPSNTGQPYLSQNGTTMVFVSRRAAGSAGGVDLWRTTITGPQSATGFVNLTELNTAENESAPVISADGLTIYYSRFVLEDGGVSATERIWSASRASAADAFTNIAPVTSLWLAASVFPTWLSPDGCTIYLASNDAGTLKILSSTRPK